MNWQQQWINEILTDIPAGRYRSRMAALCHWLKGWAMGCVLMGILYLITSGLLSAAGFTYDQTFPGRVCYPLLSGNKTYLWIYGGALFALPFTLGAVFLRVLFRREHRLAGLVTAGLLAAWAGEKAAIILLSAMIYEMPLGAALLTRIYCGGDTTAPWFTPAYHGLTFLGCLLLGQTIGRLPIRAEPSRPPAVR